MVEQSALKWSQETAPSQLPQHLRTTLVLWTSLLYWWIGRHNCLENSLGGLYHSFFAMSMVSGACKRAANAQKCIVVCAMQSPQTVSLLQTRMSCAIITFRKVLSTLQLILRMGSLLG